MLLKLRNHTLLAVIFFLLTLIQQYSFYALKGIPIVFLSVGKYIGVFAFFFLMTFIKGNKTRLCFLSMIFLLNLLQMGHLSFFGTQILPAEFYHTFSQLHEVQGTLKEEFQHILIPLLFTLVPFVIGQFANRKFRPLFGWRVVAILVSLYLVYNPVRTYITGNTWGRQPSTRELTGMNVYLSFSYFLGKILPYKISQRGTSKIENSSMKLEIKPGNESKWDKIIIVLGESLTPRHMQLFGYKYPTTPFLSNLQKDFFYTTGLSGGVSTDIAVAFFMNLAFGSAGGVKAATGNHCLFKLAQDNKFGTHFLSIQSREQLRYITPYLCASSLEDSRVLEDISPNTSDHQAAKDRDLLIPLNFLLQEKGKKFIILHQRGSHSPWALRYSEEARKFTESKDQRINDYDNSVLEFDFFWKSFFEVLSKSQEKILVVYLSDHGETLGEEGKWGHGFIRPTSLEVPIMIMSFNRPLPQIVSTFPNYLTHYNVGLFLAEEIGHTLNQPSNVLPHDYEVFGNDIDGFAGKAAIKFKDKTYLIEGLP